MSLLKEEKMLNLNSNSKTQGYLGQKGFTILKKNLSIDEQEKLKKEQLMKQQLLLRLPQMI